LTKPVRRDALLAAVSEWAKPNRRALLVVDDSVDTRQLFTRFIDKDGRFRACWADSGKRALAMLDAGRFHGVLLDVEMPEMDGIALARAIRARHGDEIPLVAASGHADSKIREQCLRAGCNAYVTKPLRRPELVEVVTTVFDEA
jgi:CheY-like chemotaxis protein